MVVELSGGFAVVGAGAWLFGRAQPAAARGTLKSRSLKGFVCPDRGALAYGGLAAVDTYIGATSLSESSSGRPPSGRTKSALVFALRPPH